MKKRERERETAKRLVENLSEKTLGVKDSLLEESKPTARQSIPRRSRRSRSTNF
jgi:hypothetical protein